MKDRTNTIAGWVLAGAIAALGLSIVTGEYFHAERPEKMGYAVEGVEAEGDAGGGEAAEKPIAFYLQTADAAKGGDVFKKCAACHNAEKGGPNQIGPNLWGVLGEPIGQGAGGFAFSEALKAKGGTWDFDKLSDWLKSPKKFADGTKMTFAGLSKPEDRANLIAYLDKQTDHPMPFPPAPVDAPATAAGTNADSKPGANTVGEGAKQQPVITEQDAAKNPKAVIGGDGAPSVTGTAKQTAK